MDLVAHIQKVLIERIGSDYTQHRYILGVSGGMDSMALFHVMAKLIPIPNLFGAHFNHGLRGDDAEGDEKLVVDTLKSYGVEVHVGHIKNQVFSEEHLRHERLSFLEQIRSTCKASYIVLAQHANDQLETFMMRLIRGTGLDGLKGMGFINGRLLRPMIEVSKEDICQYSKNHQVAFREDASNYSDKYFRNRLRNHLVPVLRFLSGEYGGEKLFLRRFSSLLEEVDFSVRFLNRRLLSWYALHCKETPFWIHCSLKSYGMLSLEWKKRLLRAIASKLGNSSLSRKQLSGVLWALDGGVRRHEFGGKLDYIISCGHVFFRNALQRARAKKPCTVHLQGSKLVSPELGIELWIQPKLLKTVKARFYSPGDRVYGTKLKKWFLENRIPSVERPLVMVLVDKNTSKVLWVFPQKHPEIEIKKVSFGFSFL